LATGLFLVCCGYALSRASAPFAIETYFLGEFIVVLAPLIFFFRNLTIPHSEAVWICLSIGVATFLISACYSPLGFAFSDEFQHSSTAASILASGHLFHFNPAL